MSGRDFLRDVGLPAGVVEAVGERARRVLGQEEALDGRAPVEGAVAPAQPGQDVLGIARLGGEAGVLEAVHPVLQADADLVLAMGVGHHRLAALVGGLHHGADLVVGHLVLVDELDEVHPRVHQLLDLGPGVLDALHSPADRLLVIEVGPVLDEGPRDEEAGSRDLALLDAAPDRKAVLEGGPEVAHGGHPAHQELLRGDGHDLVPEAGHVGGVPMLVVGVAEDHQVDMHVHEAGEHAHARRVDDRGAGRYRHLGARAHGHDPLARDEHDPVVDRRPLVAVDDLAPHEGKGGLGRVRRDQGAGGQEGQDGGDSHGCEG